VDSGDLRGVEWRSDCAVKMSGLVDAFFVVLMC
jgi:hypothetical protein